MTDACAEKGDRVAIAAGRCVRCMRQRTPAVGRLCHCRVQIRIIREPHGNTESRGMAEGVGRGREGHFHGGDGNTYIACDWALLAYLCTVNRVLAAAG